MKNSFQFVLSHSRHPRSSGSNWSASTIQACFVLCCPHVQQVSLCLFQLKSTRHCCWHRNCQLSTVVFHGKLEFLVFRINDKYHVIFWHFRVLVSRLPTFASHCVSMHRTCVSTSLATKCLAWRSFVFLPVSPEPCTSIRWFSTEYSESCETCPRI